MRTYSGNQSFLKELNMNNALRLIRLKKIISRAEVADTLGLNRSTLTSIANELIERRLVNEVGIGVSKGGRPPKLLQFNTEAAYTACVDWSTYKPKVFITNLGGDIYLSETVENQSNESVASQIHNVIKIISNGLNVLPKKHLGLLGIGIGFPGIVENGTVSSFSLNWTRVPLYSYFADAFQCPIVINSDATAGLIAEKYFGCAMGEENTCYIRVGKTLGASLMINNEIYRGSEGFTGRVGHFTIDVNGRKCSCGNRGCWEAYASERALMQRYAEISGQPATDALTDVSEIMKRAKNSDPAAISAVHEFAEYLGIGIGSIVNFLNPNLIIINNASGLMDNLVYSTLNSVLQQKILPYLRRNIRVLFSTLGENDMTLGATAMVLDKFFDIPNVKA